MVITLSKTMLSKHCILFCAGCETETNHVLTDSGQCYVCWCGNVIDVELEEDEK